MPDLDRTALQAALARLKEAKFDLLIHKDGREIVSCAYAVWNDLESLRLAMPALLAAFDAAQASRDVLMEQGEAIARERDVLQARLDEAERERDWQYEAVAEIRVAYAAVEAELDALRAAIVERGKQCAVWITGDPDDAAFEASYEDPVPVAWRAIDSVLQLGVERNNEANTLSAEVDRLREAGGEGW